MTKQTILKKAIEKAIKNGWENPLEGKIATGGLDLNPELPLSEYFIIFSHDFAKAFWKLNKAKDWVSWRFEGNEVPGDRRTGAMTGWCYHLSQMVLEKDPIKYLEKFL